MKTTPKWAIFILGGIPKGASCSDAEGGYCYYWSSDECHLAGAIRKQQSNPRKLKACRDFCKAMGWEG